MSTSPLIIAGTGSRLWEDLDLILAAFTHLAGDRKDVRLRVGDAWTGGDVLLKTAAFRLGWPRPQVYRARWNDWCPDCHSHPGTQAHRKRRPDGTTYCPVAGHLRNSAIVDDQPKAHAGVALMSAWRWNGGTLDCASKMANAGIPVLICCDACGGVFHREPCAGHSIKKMLDGWRIKTQGALM